MMKRTILAMLLTAAGCGAGPSPALDVVADATVAPNCEQLRADWLATVDQMGQTCTTADDCVLLGGKQDRAGDSARCDPCGITVSGHCGVPVSDEFDLAEDAHELEASFLLRCGEELPMAYGRSHCGPVDCVNGTCEVTFPELECTVDGDREGCQI
jgi:hypothetical protein